MTRTDRLSTATMTDARGYDVVMTGEYCRSQSAARFDGKNWWDAVVEYTDCDGWAKTRVVGGTVRGAVAARKMAARWAFDNADSLCA